MNNFFLVSVIIPVYNAERYLSEAVESAISIPEVGEVILVDDASTDNSLALCFDLAEKWPKIKVLQHPEEKNLGAAATRNKGMEAASCDYIAFLDADDLYLPDRFKREQEVFLADGEVDAVYGCNKAIFENEAARKKFLMRYESETTTVKKSISPADLFRVLLFGGQGRFHTSAITLRKRALKQAGLFNTSIRNVEDTEYWLRLSLKAKLVPGSIEEPISIRRVHDNNSIHDWENVAFYKRKMYQSLFDWAVTQNLTFDVKNCFFIALHQFANVESCPVRKLFWRQVACHPKMVRTSFFYKKIFQLYFR